MTHLRIVTIVVLSCAPFAKAQDAKNTPALPGISARVFSISDHGAVASESADNAEAIQKTIDAAAAAGGGIVEVPAG